MSLSPLYLIRLLIHHPRTNSKNGLCDLCVGPIPTRTRDKKASSAYIIAFSCLWVIDIVMLMPFSMDMYVLVSYGTVHMDVRMGVLFSEK